MNIYEQARRHAWFMAGALLIAVMFVVVVDIYVGHSVIAFGVAIVGLVAANRQMLRYNCPTCGKNLFFRGNFAVPWPQKVCGKCGTRLAAPDQP